MKELTDSANYQSLQSLATDLEVQSRYFSAIDSISNDISSALTTEELLQSALERVAEVTGADEGAIYLPHSDGAWLLVANHNTTGRNTVEFEYINKDFPGLQLVLSGRGPVAYNERIHEPSQYVSERSKELGIQSWAGIAITCGSTVCGMLTIASKEFGAFGGANLNLLRVVGQLIGLALSSALGHSKALQQADRGRQETAAEMEAVLSSMSDGLIICDSAGLITQANESAGRMLGASPEKLVGNSILSPEWNQMPPEGEAGYDPASTPFERLIKNGEEFVNAALVLTVGGEQRALSVSASHILKKGIERPDSAVVVLRDVTDEREANEMREGFLSLLSHELRAPVTVISGYAQMLSRRLGRQGLTNEARSADLIREQSNRMTAMINDLVDSDRLESGLQTLSTEPTDLGVLVEEVVRRTRMEHLHTPTSHEFTVEVEAGLPQIEADRRRIDQALTNLLGNAVKYSEEGSPIHVSVISCIPTNSHGDTPKAETLRVEVTDRGVGVPPSDKQRVFDRAFRGERGMQISAQGLGLGLYIIRLAIEAHGGRIGVEDGPDRVGSTFWFDLPVD